MYTKAIFLVAGFGLPLLAAPLPGNEITSPKDVVKRQEGVSLASVLDVISKREPVVETLPTEAQADLDIEKRDEDLALEDDIEDDSDIEKRGRIGTKPIGKRGRIGTHPIGRRGRIGGGPIGSRSLLQRALDNIFG